jgi:hypothetical protein
LGSRQEADEEKTPVPNTNGRNGSIASAPSFAQPGRPSSRLGSVGGSDSEILRLKTELAERDRRLAEQAASLSDMEASVKELSGLLPTDGPTPNSAYSFSMEGEGQNAAQLRQMLREKNEKITLLTSEFDAHRADFRSTLDSLEMASTETERVYEEQKRDLLIQAEQMSERIQELEDLNSSKKDFEDVARQLKGLEEFVQELEEGLEDARRGEAEARGEVEFLRGEVERCRSELKRERERSAAANGIGASKEIEQKDDEIRGLKAIIHSMSTGDSSTTTATLTKESDEIKRLQTALDDSNKEKETLEHELEQLRRNTAVTNGHSRNESDMTATLSNSGGGGGARSRASTFRATFVEHARRAAQENQAHLSTIADGSTAPGGGSSKPAAADVFCEMCESKEHDTFDCTHFQGNHDTSTEDGDLDDAASNVINPLVPASSHRSLSPGKENQAEGGRGAHNAAKANGEKKKDDEADKWCALCEKDGHLAYECPDEI